MNDLTAAAQITQIIFELKDKRQQNEMSQPDLDQIINKLNQALRKLYEHLKDKTQG